MTVAFGHQGHEQIAGGDGPTIDGNPIEIDVRPLQMTGEFG